MDKLYNGDCLEVMCKLIEEGVKVDTIITSPPYWSLREYGDSGFEIGRETTIKDYIDNLINIFEKAKDILSDTGTCWVNLGDTYVSKGATRHIGWSDPKNKKVGAKKHLEPSGLKQVAKEKSLAGIPDRFKIAMIDNGWICRNDIIWYKRNAMPSSVKDRFTVDYERIFFFTKNKKYYFKQQLEPYTEKMNRWGGEKKLKSIDEKIDETGKANSNSLTRVRDMRPNKKGKNMRCVWDIPTKSSNIKHFAMFPDTLVERMINAGCPIGGTVFDPFMGAGNTLTTANKLGMNSIGIELYEKYYNIAKERLSE